MCCACMLSRVRLFLTLWTVLCQAPLPMEFSKQEYWDGLPFPSPEDLPNPGMEPASLVSPALAGRFFTTSATWEAPASCFRATDITLASLVAQAVKCLPAM